MTLPDPPAVHFDEHFLARLGRVGARVRCARERQEGRGRAGLLGGGVEFVGYRAYRPGEDLRRLDWELYARHRRPFVRLTRRESAERWAVLLDTSASMGVGRPTKLQLGAEVALALLALAADEHADARLLLSAGSGVARRGGRAPGVPEWMACLEGTRPQGNEGLAELLPAARSFQDAGTVFWVGDLAALEPADLMRSARRGRELVVVQVLAPMERDPMGQLDATPGESVRWVDPETGSARTVPLSGAVVAAYERALEARLEAWRALASRTRVRFVGATAGEPFERVVEEVFGC